MKTVQQTVTLEVSDETSCTLSFHRADEASKRPGSWCCTLDGCECCAEDLFPGADKILSALAESMVKCRDEKMGFK